MSTAASLLTILSIGLTFLSWIARKVAKLTRALLTELRANTVAVKQVRDKLDEHLQQGHPQ